MTTNLGNIVSRLQGLKNVSGRRVMPGSELLKNLEDTEADVTGTSIPMPDLKQNIPEADLGGEITPQSYDVRANQIQNPGKKEDSNFWTNFGKALAMQTGNIPAQNALQPPIETQEVQAEEGLPITNAQEEISPEYSNDAIWGTVGKALTDYAKPFKTEGQWYGEATPETAKMMEDAQIRSEGFLPDTYRAEQAQIKANTQQEIQGKIDNALQKPGETAVYGASDIVANQPDLQQSFQLVTGMDFNEEIARQTSEYEKVLDDLDSQINLEGNGYNEQEQRIKERILANQSTDADKFYIGLAVLMPLLVGAFFGKEAALGALGGGAKGFAEILGRRQKENLENEELLADIGQNKANIGLKKAELNLKKLAIPTEIRKNLPKDEREFLKGKKEFRWVDPNTQEQKVGYEIKPNLIALPEYVSSDEELKEMRKEANEISSAINPTKEINKLTNDIIEISGKMKDKNFLSQALSSFVSGKNPGLATQLGEQIEYGGRKVNSYVVLEHKLKLLVDAYRQAKGMRALTNTVQEHIDSLFRNPAASFQSYQDTIDQMLYTRDLAQSRLLNTVSSAGFAPEFVIESLKPETKAVYNTLNKREGEKESQELLRE